MFFFQIHSIIREDNFDTFFFFVLFALNFACENGFWNWKKSFLFLYIYKRWVRESLSGIKEFEYCIKFPGGNRSQPCARLRSCDRYTRELAFRRCKNWRYIYIFWFLFLRIINECAWTNPKSLRYYNT